MVCVPVVSALNGPVRHVVVTLIPTGMDLDKASRLDAGAAPAHRLNGVNHRDCNPATARSSAAAANCPSIFPRRKAGGRGNPPASARGPTQPVVVSLELLNTLSGMPLHRAAEQIGVSATALKKVRVAQRESGGGGRILPCSLLTSLRFPLANLYSDLRAGMPQVGGEQVALLQGGGSGHDRHHRRRPSRCQRCQICLQLQCLPRRGVELAWATTSNRARHYRGLQCRSMW